MNPEHHLRNSFHSLRSDVDIRVSDNSEVISTLVRVTIICACFMVIELIGGYWANSVAVISDALHLSIDIIGYAIQITSAKLAMKKSNKTMNFGYYRFEPIGAVLNCFTIWLLTLYLVAESYSRILNPPKHFEEGVMLFTAAFGVAANMAMAAVIHGPGIILTMFKYPFMSAAEKDAMMIQEGGENLNIRTVMAHINGDLIYSVGVLLAAILININNDWKILDPLLTILFSFVVLHITVPVFKDSMTMIFEANADVDRYDTVTKEIYGLDKVNKINSLRLWSLTQDQICATVHVTVNEGTDEQSLQHKIGKILQKNEVNFWAVQVWKTNFRYACCFTESHEQT